MRQVDNCEIERCVIGEVDDIKDDKIMTDITAYIESLNKIDGIKKKQANLAEEIKRKEEEIKDLAEVLKKAEANFQEKWSEAAQARSDRFKTSKFREATAARNEAQTNYNNAKLHLANANLQQDKLHRDLNFAQKISADEWGKLSYLTRLKYSFGMYPMCKRIIGPVCTPDEEAAAVKASFEKINHCQRRKIPVDNVCENADSLLPSIFISFGIQLITTTAMAIMTGNFLKRLLGSHTYNAEYHRYQPSHECQPLRMYHRGTTQQMPQRMPPQVNPWSHGAVANGYRDYSKWP